MKKIINKIVNSISINTKLILTYIIVAIITVSVIGVYSAKKMKEIVINKSVNEARTNVNIMQYRMDELLRLTTRVSDMLYLDNSLQSIISTQYNSYCDVYREYSNYTEITDYLNYYKEISNITIYADNPTLLNGRHIEKPTEVIKNRSWYKKAQEESGKIFWEVVKDEYSSKENLSLVRGLKNNHGTVTGVLVISIDPLQLAAIANSNDENYVIELDEKSISKKYNFKPDKSMLEVCDTYENDKGKTYIEKGRFRGTESYVIENIFNADKAFSNIFGVYIVLPLSDVIAQTNEVILSIRRIMIFTITISMIIIVFFSRNISNRIKLLRWEMGKVVKGNFNVGNIIEGKDEIGDLYKDLNLIRNSINKLINDVYIEKIQKEKLKAYQKDIEFKMLANQINPHFLYNTLETIRMKALCNGDKEISDIVKKLGKIMRRNLEASGKEVSLSSELNLIEDYLEIQTIRFEDRFEYKLDISKEVNIESYKILPLLIQPIVENAFVHGLEDKSEKGDILIRIYYSKKFLNIEVVDNGVGMAEDKLCDIRNNIERDGDNKKSIGMRNINERIKIYYGNDYGLKVDSGLNWGTKVKIYLPKDS